jgi:hypothetical protein
MNLAATAPASMPQCATRALTCRAAAFPSFRPEQLIASLKHKEADLVERDQCIEQQHAEIRVLRAELSGLRCAMCTRLRAPRMPLANVSGEFVDLQAHS